MNAPNRTHLRRRRGLAAASLAVLAPLGLSACDGGFSIGAQETTETVTAGPTTPQSPTAGNASQEPTAGSPAQEPTADGGQPATWGGSQDTGTPPPVSSPPGSSAPGSPADTGGTGACSELPTDPDLYADRYIQAWGVGDVETMRCLAVPEAVSYTLDLTAEAGPGWTRLDASGEQQTRAVRYGSPNKKTTITVTVDKGRPGQPQQIVTARIG